MPSQSAQEALIESVYRRARCHLATVGYFEAHGTGTKAGDPIEAGAIGATIGRHRGLGRDNRLYVGSIKSNIGHTEGCSGVASLIKTVLALEKGLIPPNFGFEKGNPAIDFEAWRIRVPTEVVPWPVSGIRRASINSFGFGGSNCHVILDDAHHYLAERGISASHCTSGTPKEATGGHGEATGGVSRHRIFVWSGWDARAVKASLAAYGAHLESTDRGHANEELLMRDLSHTLCQRRSRLATRTFMVANSVGGLVTRLGQPGPAPVRSLSKPPRIAYVFTGQGAQWWGMARELLETYPVFQDSMARAEASLRSLGCPWSLRDELTRNKGDSRVNDAEYGFPACTAIQLGLVDLLADWGVLPEKVIGHSGGETAAAYAAGKLPFESSVKVAYFRGLLMPHIEGKGSMLAAGISEAAALDTISRLDAGLGQVVVACINSPTSVTLSGDTPAMEELEKMLQDEDKPCRRLRVTKAFHSHHVRQVADRYLESLADLVTTEPGVASPFCGEMMSTVFCASTAGLKLDAQYWVDNLCRPVRFSDGLRALCSVETPGRRTGEQRGNGSVDVMLQIGPHSALAGPISQTLAAEGVRMPYYSVLVRDRDACETALEALAALWAHGAPARLDRANEPLQEQQAPRVLVDLPAYPWDHSKRLWASPRVGAGYRLRAAPRGDFIGAPVPDWNPHEPCWRNYLRVGEQPWLRDHVVQGSMVYPAAGYLAMVLEAARQLVPPTESHKVVGYTIANVAMNRALVIPDTDEGVEVIFQARTMRRGNGPSGDGAWRDFRIYSHSSAGPTEHCRGLFSIDHEQAPSEVDGGRESRESLGHYEGVFEGARDTCKSPIRAEALYMALLRVGIDFGPMFCNLTELKVGASRALAKIRVPDTKRSMPFEHESEHLVHPATLDAILQLVLPAMTRNQALKQAYMPTLIEQVHVSSKVARGAGRELEACVEAASVGLREVEASGVARNGPGEAPVVRMRGIRLTALASSNTASEDSDPLLFVDEWLPDPDLMSRAELEDWIKPATGHSDDYLVEFWSQLNTMALFYYHQALRCVSLDQVVQPHHRKFYLYLERRREAMLTGHQRATWLNFDTPAGQSEMEEMGRVVETESREGELVCRMGRSLPGILRNEVAPLHLLFHDNLLGRVYDQMAENGAMFAQMQQYIRLLSHKSPHLSYIEIGAGTGAATIAALEALGGARGDGRRFKRYTFTDISSVFLETAAARLQRWEGLVDYRTLDIEQSPGLQGFADAERFDVVIAFHVLHATADLDTTVRNVRQLLKPGGKLILLELTNVSDRMACAVAPLPGWWAAEDTHRQHGEGPVITATKWAEMLVMNGFGDVRSSTPNSNNPDLEACSVIVAEAAPDAGPVPVNPDTGAADGALPWWSVTVATGDGHGHGDGHGGQETALVDALRAQLLAMGVDTLVKPYSDLAEADVSNRLCLVTSEMTKPLVKDMGPGDFDMLKTMLANATGLVWATTGALGDSPRPDVALIHGLARTLRNEHPGFPLLTFDFSESQLSPRRGAAMLMARLREAASGHVSETEFSERNGLVHINRYMDAGYDEHLRVGEPTAPELQPFSQPGRPLILTIGTPGLLDTLIFTDDDSAHEPLPADHVRIQVRATGLNFRDVMLGLGQLTSYSFGGECSGVIQEIGSSVSRLEVGDRVCAVARGTYSNTVSTPANCCEPIPDDMDFSEAASIPVVYCTAYYALADLARIRAGETVLVHAAAGGVGQAAIQLCRFWGADVFATVSSKQKKQLLMEACGIPENHIFSSRNIDFADGIRRVTKGKGVDIVLNCLSGEALEASWNLIAPFGRFVEIGKTDIGRDAPLAMAPFRRNVTFASLNLMLLYDERPELLGRLLQDAMALIRDGAIKPFSPIKTFSFAKLEEGFRLMQSGLHMGKIVFVAQPDDLVPVMPRARVTGRLHPDATYLIAGGLGGLGRGLARHMASRGARNLILLSRSGAQAPEAKALVGDLRDAGVQVDAVACDIADAERVDEILSDAMKRMPPIRGVIQAAMVLEDRIFANMPLESWTNAVAPKVHGSWVLHNATLHQPLDFFIMLSSLSGIIGFPSQANYSAANSFLDSLAHYRTGRRLPATTIDLCGIASIGYMAENKNPRTKILADYQSIDSIEEHQFFAIIDFAVEALPKRCQLLVDTQNLAPRGRPLEDQPAWCNDPKFSHLQNVKGRAVESRASGASGAELSLAQQLSRVTATSEVEAVILGALLKRISRLLGRTVQEDEASGPVAGLNIDSLAAVELRKWLTTAAQADISIFEIAQAASLQQLAAKVAARSSLVSRPPAP
ncbi:hypothetical protein G6O67_000122 [Ophiocordyceps sinensis]|uniref:Beta-ketoacyl synthase n=1 Tax=Ophiocordyceps sinensis TaxID=72228 RepID=A0A8H4PYK7_9HYPO|nr:hypothetical protein G6O67_000122 [Ophiocordyceps sinensis]